MELIEKIRDWYRYDLKCSWPDRLHDLHSTKYTFRYKTIKNYFKKRKWYNIFGDTYISIYNFNKYKIWSSPFERYMPLEVDGVEYNQYDINSLNEYFKASKLRSEKIDRDYKAKTRLYKLQEILLEIEYEKLEEEKINK